MAVRVALVGCGKITERLALPQLERCPGAEVAALVDLQRPVAERLADRFGVERRRIWTDWKSMLREADVDVVAVNLPNVLHAEVTIAALRAKKHVIVEKPMAMNLAEADAMLEAARGNGQSLMVEHPYRFEPAHEVAHDLLRSDVVGRILQLRGRLGHAGPEFWSGSQQSWLVDKRQSGGGALMDVGVHVVDLLRWLSGKQVRRVCAHANALEKGGSVEDNASALLEFTDGTMGSFEVSWTTRPYQVTTHFYGVRGTVRTALGAARPVVIQHGTLDGDQNVQLGEDVCPQVPASSREGGAYPSFVNGITNGTASFVSGEEGRATLAVILAAYESVRTGGWVDLPLPSA